MAARLSSGQLGLELLENTEPLAAGQAEAADMVISMGCDDACPVFAANRYRVWELPDLTG